MPAIVRFLAVICCVSMAFGSITALADEGFLRNGVTAHRGDSIRYPENTIPAFRSGIEVGADWLELDIFRTRDGHLVIAHDRTTGRVAGRDLVIADSTLEELRQLDVASEFRKCRKLSLEECPPEKMPLLEEVLQLVMTQDKTRVSIQPKMDCVPDAIALIRRLKAEKWVGFNDGNLKWMTQVKELAPEIPVFWDRPHNSNLEEDIRIAKERGFESLVVNLRGITAERIKQIQDAGLEAGAWTVNDPQVMKTFLDYGIDRIYTDDPAMLLKFISDRRK